MFLYTKVKGYFCSLLVSNIFLYTSLSLTLASLRSSSDSGGKRVDFVLSRHVKQPIYVKRNTAVFCFHERFGSAR